MKLNYYPETDSLYIDLSEQPSADSKEVSEGIVLDYDAKGNLVGIDIVIAVLIPRRVLATEEEVVQSQGSRPNTVGQQLD